MKGTSMQARLSYDLSEPSFLILQSYLHYIFAKDSFLLTRNDLEIEFLPHEKNIFIDILFFLKKFGTIKHIHSLAGTQSTRLYMILLQDDRLYEHSIYVSEEKRSEPIHRFFSKCEDGMFLKFHIQPKSDRIWLDKPELHLINDLIDQFVIKPTAQHHSDLLAYLKKERVEIDFFFHDEQVTLHNAYTCTVAPYGLSFFRELDNFAPFLSRITSFEQESRRISLGDYEAPLNEAFMRLLMRDSNENEAHPDVCTHCVFRLRQLTSGCFSCKPKKTKEKE